MGDFEDAIIAFFIGASVLTGVVAIGVRIALKPIIDSWVRLRQGTAADEAELRRDRRLQLLEAELQSMQQQLNRVTDAEEFRRQLDGPRDLPRAKPGEGVS